MTDGQREGTRAPRAGGDDVIDADFETIVPGRPSAERRAEAQPEGGSGEGRGMDMLRDGGDGPGRRSGGPVFWTVGLALVVGAFWVSGGHAIVSRPDASSRPVQTAAPFQQPLRIVNVVSRIDRQGERSFLMVDGEVANPGDARTAIPSLAIIVTAFDGSETRYYLGTNDKVLAPGERFAFSSRLHAPSEGVRTVTVDFRKEGGG